MGGCGLHTWEPDSQPKSQGAAASFPAPPGKETNCDRWECENGCVATSATLEISFLGVK